MWPDDAVARFQMRRNPLSEDAETLVRRRLKDSDDPPLAWLAASQSDLDGASPIRVGWERPPATGCTRRHR